MKPPEPPNDDDSAMREALKRDAARVPAPPFDTALHHATIRRIRALSTSDGAGLGWKLVWPAAAALVLGVGAAFWHFGPAPREAVVPETHVTAAVVPTPRAAVWVYQRTAAQSDEALLAMLDRDARTLLPTTAPAFSDPLH